MFICPIDIEPVPIQIMDNTGSVLPPTGQFCGANHEGTPIKCSCTALEHEKYAPNYGIIPIPVIPIWNK
jgi:hypothetical protein